MPRRPEIDGCRDRPRGLRCRPQPRHPESAAPQTDRKSIGGFSWSMARTGCSCRRPMRCRRRTCWTIAPAATSSCDAAPGRYTRLEPAGGRNRSRAGSLRGRRAFAGLDVFRPAKRPADRRRRRQAAAAAIADAIAEQRLSNWLKTVRHHHEGTYQHCLLVTGVAAQFALKIGLPGADVERLTFAAMLHDIGKAKIRWRSSTSRPN